MVVDAHAARQSNYYDDANFNYATWWQGREYEHEAEVMAIRRLLRDRRFAHAVDVGGGFGRLSCVLAEYADLVTLVDPSHQQLELASNFLARYPATVARQLEAAGLRIESRLSVSNLRSSLAKKVLSESVLLRVEHAAQERLARLRFGPSMFFFVQK